MNENCKYCKTAKTCLENAEYNSIYCHMHKRIPKIIDKTYEELQNENQQLKDKLEASEKARKEAIDEIKELYDNTDDTTCYDIDKDEKERLLQILDIDKGE